MYDYSGSIIAVIVLALVAALLFMLDVYMVGAA